MIFIYLNSTGPKLENAIDALQGVLKNNTPYLLVTDEIGLAEASSLPNADFLRLFPGQPSRLYPPKEICVVSSRPIPRYQIETDFVSNENILGLLPTCPNGLWVIQLIELNKEEITSFIWSDKLLSGLHQLENGISIFGKPSFSI